MKNNKTLFENISALTFLKLFEYALPLLTLPYLVKTLGIKNYGLISFAMAFMSYFVIVTNYGFDLTATRAISTNKQNLGVVNRVYSSVFTIKFTLMLICLFVMLGIVELIPKFEVDSSVYLTAFLIVIGNVLFPVWFFQGMENMKYITFINVSSRLIVTLSIFLFIHSQNDYLLAMLINSLSYFLPGLIGFIVVMYKYKMRFVLPKKEELVVALQEGWHIFLSSFLGNIIASSSIFVLGLTNSKEVVGIYSAIEKLIRAVIGFFMPITQALFPYVSARFAESYELGVSVVKKSGKIILMLALSVALVTIVLAPIIIKIIYPDNLVSYSNILRILAFWFVVSIFNNIIGYQYLIASGQEKIYSKSFVIAAIITLALFFSLAGPFSMYGIVFAMLLGELSLTISMGFFIKRKLSVGKG